MPWYPGNSRYYNETPSPRVSLALSASLAFNAIPEDETHTQFNEFEGSAFTDSLNARPSTDHTAKRGVSYSRQVETAQPPQVPKKR
jgi:hypothetical protein